MGKIELYGAQLLTEKKRKLDRTHSARMGAFYMSNVKKND